MKTVFTPSLFKYRHLNASDSEGITAYYSIMSDTLRLNPAFYVKICIVIVIVGHVRKCPIITK